MEPKELALSLAQALSDKQAIELEILDVEALVSYTSYFVIASGRSERQVSAMADYAQRHTKKLHHRGVLGIEGVQKGLWALIDYGDVIVHLFREPERELYDLDGLWQDAPRVPFVPAPQSASIEAY